MLHLKLLISTILVAGCLLHVGGIPTDPSKQDSGYFGYAKSFASRGAGLLGSGVSAGASMVGSGVSAGASKVGSGVSAGASMVGSGVSAGASMVGSGVSSAASSVDWSGLSSGIVSTVGSGTQYTLDTLSKALSAVNTQSLTAALGLPADLSKAISDKVDLSAIFTKLVMGQSQTADGVMNYETAIVFLEKLSEKVPSLKKAADAFKTVSYVMNKMKEMEGKGKKIDPTKVMKEAINVYFKDVDPALKKKLITLAPMVYDAARGDKDAAKKIAYSLADRDMLLEAVKGMGYGSQIELIKAVINQVSSYASQVKNADSQSAQGLASRGYGMLGSALSSGYGMVGSGLSAGASMVGSGLSAGASMDWRALATTLGSSSTYSLHNLATALSSVNTKTLTSALGLPADLTKAIANKFDLSSILPNILVGQGHSGEGAMNYETAMLVLEKLAIMVPTLKKTIDAFKTVSYVMNKMREMQNEGKEIDATSLMKDAVDIYFMDVDPAFKKKLLDLSPEIYDAAFGDTDAAWKVAHALADRETVLQALKGMGYGRQVEILRTLINQVTTYASFVKTEDAAQSKKK